MARMMARMMARRGHPTKGQGKHCDLTITPPLYGTEDNVNRQHSGSLNRGSAGYADSETYYTDPYRYAEGHQLQRDVQQMNLTQENLRNIPEERPLNSFRQGQRGYGMKQQPARNNMNWPDNSEEFGGSGMQSGESCQDYLERWEDFYRSRPR